MSSQKHTMGNERTMVLLLSFNRIPVGIVYNNSVALESKHQRTTRFIGNVTELVKGTD
jgi:hypothetical protein